MAVDGDVEKQALNPTSSSLSSTATPLVLNEGYRHVTLGGISGPPSGQSYNVRTRLEALSKSNPVPWRLRWAIRRVLLSTLGVGILLLGLVWWSGWTNSIPVWNSVSPDGAKGMSHSSPEGMECGDWTFGEAWKSPLISLADMINAKPQPVFRPEIKPSPLLTWAQDLSASDLTSGLTSPTQALHHGPPLSNLGEAADKAYHLGPSHWPEYISRIDEFVGIALPPSLQAAYAASKDDGRAWDGDAGKKIWQTDKDEDRVDHVQVKSWRNGRAQNEGWEWDLLTDRTATQWIKQYLGGTRLAQVWDILPKGILNSDYLRYLLLALHGGIYTDTDTILLQPPSSWGRGAALWKDGKGWVSDGDLERIENATDKDSEIDRLIGRAKLVVGIEADVGEREDWADWWPRPIVQWTMASSPFHPVTLDALLRILHNTATAITFAQRHHEQYLAAMILDDIPQDELEKLAKTDVMSEPRDGGPLGVINWTGPAVWTDAVLSYLKARYGMEWTDLRGLQAPMRVGDVVVLPVTGFSPGVRNFGAKEVWDPQAMVEHAFRGSWKHHDS